MVAQHAARRTLAAVAVGGLLVAAQVGWVGSAYAAGEGPVVTLSKSTLSPGGPDGKVVIDGTAPFNLDFDGTGNQALGWELPKTCNNNVSPVVCTPDATGKTEVTIGVMGGDQGGKAGQQVTFTATAVGGTKSSSATLTFGEPVTAADWVVENPDSVTYQNPGGTLTKPFTVQYFQRHNTTDSAVLTVTGVKGIKFTKAPDGCTLNPAGTTATCTIAPLLGGHGPKPAHFEGVISGDEQIVESKITGKLPENEPADNTDRAVYRNTVQPDPNTTPAPTPSAPAAGNPNTQPPAKTPELAETGGDDHNTTLIAGTAAGLLLLAGGAYAITRRRNTTTT